MCEHKNIKYFVDTQRVVCLDCGKTWDDNNNVLPLNPIIYPLNPTPIYPTYPPMQPYWGYTEVTCNA